MVIIIMGENRAGKELEGTYWGLGGVSECPFNEASEKPSLIRSFLGTDFMEKREQAIRFPNICGMVVSGREIKVRKTRSRMGTKASVEGAGEAWGKKKETDQTDDGE